MKLIRYFLINRVTKNPMIAARIYQMIYHPEMVPSSVRTSSPSNKEQVTKLMGSKSTNKISKSLERPNRYELQETLDRLREVREPNHVQRNAIQMLEASLRNMR
jgi:hypothetical protein